MAKLSALGYAGFAFETTYGTPVNPQFWVPYDTIKVEDDIKKVEDQARRGVLSKTFAVYNTVQSGKVEMDMDAYPELLGYFFKAILGQDTVTGTGPYTHTFKVMNALPPSMTIFDYNTITYRQYPGAVLHDLSLKFDTEDLLKVSAKFESFASVTTTSQTNTDTTTDPFKGFQATLQLGGSPNTNLVGGEISIKRDVKLIYGANNTQNPTKFSAGRIEVTGKLTFDIEDESEWLLYRNGQTPSLQLLFTRDTNTTLQFTCSKIDITKAHIDRSQEFLRVDMDFKALYNTTDAGMIQIVLKNNVQTY